MANSGGLIDRLRDAAEGLRGLEFVPGVPIEPPTFQGPWGPDDFAVFGGASSVPASLHELLCEVGGIEAIDVGQGVGFLQPAALARLRRRLEGVGDAWLTGVARRPNRTPRPPFSAPSA